MNHLASKTLIVALSLCAAQVMAETPKPVKTDEVLIDLGAELKAKSGSDTNVSRTPITSKNTQKSAGNNPMLASSENKVTDSHTAHWSYSGETGPRHWGDLAPENINCKIGKNQSPIDLRDRAA